MTIHQRRIHALHDFLTGAGVYGAACIGSYLYRYFDDYLAGLEIQFEFSWEIGIFTAVLGFMSAAFADYLRGRGKRVPPPDKQLEEASAARRAAWKVRARDAFILGIAVDATVGRFLDRMGL